MFSRYDRVSIRAFKKKKKVKKKGSGVGLGYLGTGEQTCHAFRKCER